MYKTNICEWNEITELSAAIVNASSVLEEATAALFDRIAELEKKYGEHIDLLATKGDFARDLPDQVRILEKTLDFPSSMSKMLAVSSLAEALGEIVGFVRDRPNYRGEFKNLLDLYASLLDEFPDTHESEKLGTLRKLLISL